MKLDLENKNVRELKRLMDIVKISDYDYNTKTDLLLQIESKLGINCRNDAILKEIAESAADIDDLGA